MPVRLVLALECTSPTASVVLAGPEGVFHQETVAAGRKPSEVLMNPLGEALAALPAGAVLGAVVVGTGPGSYNGARVAIATGQGVAMVRDCAVAGISSLEALPTVRAGGRVLAVGDARRETRFVVRIEDGRLVGETELCAPEDLAGMVREALRAGARVVTLEEVARLVLPAELAARVAVETPRAELLAAAWAERTPDEQAALAAIPPEPFYLREAYITTPKKR